MGVKRGQLWRNLGELWRKLGGFWRKSGELDSFRNKLVNKPLNDLNSIELLLYYYRKSRSYNHNEKKI